MANQPFVNDFVRETSATTGTGDITLLGAVASFRTFASMFVENDTFYYTAKHRTLLEAESGIGTLTASGTIARTSVLESTNANAAVPFSAGTKDVFIAPISKMFPTLATNEIWQGVTGGVPIATDSPSLANLLVANTVDTTTLQADGIGTAQLIVTDNSSFAATVTIASQNASLQPLILKGASGQTANLLECQNNTNAVLLSVQPGGEIRGNVGANAAIVLQEASGVSILSGGVATQWADSVAQSVRIRLGDITPSSTNNVVFCAANAAQFARLAILGNVVQVVRNTATTAILAPITNVVFEVQGNSVGNILVGLRARASQTANLLATYDSTDTLMSSIGPGGQFRIPSGTNSAPGLALQTNTNTGLYSDASGSLNIVCSSLIMLNATVTSITCFSTAATRKALILKGFAAQSGNLLEFQTDTASLLSNVTADGKFQAASGDATTPGLGFRSQTGTGLYQATNIVGLSLAGTSRIEVLSTGSVILAKAGALLTTATGGFTYLPTCPGKPTGVPTAQTGTVPLVVDSTNSANFIYSGAEWVCVGPTTTVLVFRGAPGTPGPPETVGVNKGAEITMPYAGKFLRARARAKTAPTGADLILDINLNGTTIWSTQANRLKIVAGANSGSQSTFNTVNFLDGDVMTIDVDQIGSTVAGSDLTVQLEIRKTG